MLDLRFFNIIIFTLLSYCMCQIYGLSMFYFYTFLAEAWTFLVYYSIESYKWLIKLFYGIFMLPKLCLRKNKVQNIGFKYWRFNLIKKYYLKF